MMTVTIVISHASGFAVGCASTISDYACLDFVRDLRPMLKRGTRIALIADKGLCWRGVA